jgi:hypothetical protein
VVLQVGSVLVRRPGFQAVDTPPPATLAPYGESFQTTSETRTFPAPSVSRVPPTAVTNGDTAGHDSGDRRRISVTQPADAAASRTGGCPGPGGRPHRQAAAVPVVCGLPPDATTGDRSVTPRHAARSACIRCDRCLPCTKLVGLPTL